MPILNWADENIRSRRKKTAAMRKKHPGAILTLGRYFAATAGPWIATMLSLFCPLSAQDLHGFWRKSLSQLAAEPMEAQVEPLHEALPYRKIRITLRSLDG